MTYKTTFAKKLSCRIAGSLLAALMAASTLTYAQNAAVSSVVPSIVNYNGTLADGSGKPLTATSGVTFSLYKDSDGGAPLWMETQNIQPDSRGHFSAKLGSASGQGLPADLFASGEARWLGVQVQGQAEQPRVLLLSVPYALKAADAETLGGMPASAFMMAKPGDQSPSATEGSGRPGGAKPQTSYNVTTTGGTANYVPLWNGATSIGLSSLSQTGALSMAIDGSLTVDDNLYSGGFVEALGGLFDGSVTGAYAGFNAPAGISGNAVVGESDEAGFSSVGGVNEVTSALSYGVSGQSMSSIGIGVVGFGPAFSKTFSNHVGYEAFGVVGDAVNDIIGGGAPIGVWGVADNGIGITSENSSSTEPSALLLNFDTKVGDLALEAGGNTGHCTVDTKGDLACTGSKSAVVTLEDNRSVRLYAVESPENWFEDFGSGQLSIGSAEIALEPTFAQTVNAAADYRVFPVPNGDCKGLYVSEKTPTGFVVRELGGGTSSVTFDYRIVARRKGYENIRLEDVTERQSQIAATREQMMKTNGGKTVPLPTKISKQ